MKKVLLASTALIISAGYAAADVSTSGSANVGMKYIEDDGSNSTAETQLHYELDFGIAGSGETDGGIEFGASMDFDLDDSAESDNIDDPEVFISGEFGTVTFGAVDDASDNIGLGFSDPGFDGIGIDDAAETFIAAGTANALYTATFGDLSVAASGHIDDSDDRNIDDYAVGAAYSFGDFTAQVAISSVAGTAVGDADITYVGFEGAVANVSFDLFWHQASGTTDIAGYGGSVGFDAGLVDIIAAVGATDIDTDDVDFGVGAEYDLGGGATLAGGIGTRDNPFTTVDSIMVADFGINMSF